VLVVIGEQVENVALVGYGRFSHFVHKWFCTTLFRADGTDVFMVALCNRADHNIFMLFLLSSSSFFPRLISSVGDWMFTILWHMVWP